MPPKKPVASAATTRNGKSKAPAPEAPPAQKRKINPPPEVVDVKDTQVALPTKPPPLDRKAVSGMLTALKYAADPFFDRPGKKEAQQALEVNAKLHNIAKLKLNIAALNCCYCY
jgi:hypothetical protein